MQSGDKRRDAVAACECYSQVVCQRFDHDLLNCFLMKYVQTRGNHIQFRTARTFSRAEDSQLGVLPGMDLVVRVELGKEGSALYNLHPWR